MRLPVVVSAAILAACTFSAASAQTSVDRTFKATGQDCRDVEWSQEVLREYPGIGAACQSVEQRAGKMFVKFEGTVREVRDQGKQLRIDFKEGETLTLAPPANAVLYLDGRKTPMSQLRPGNELNFYVPEDQLTAQFLADDAGTSVDVPIVSEQIVAREQSAPAEAGVDRETVAARELPATASALPLLGLSGAMLLLLAAGMALYRAVSR